MRAGGGARADTLRTGVRGCGPKLRAVVSGHAARRRGSLGLLLAAALGLGAAARGQLPAPDPPWTQGDATLRHVFEPSRLQRIAMVSVPAEIAAGQPVSRLVAVADGADLPVRVLHADEQVVVALIDALGVSSGTPVALYAVGGDAPVEAAETNLSDPAPIWGEVRAAAGQDLPDSWRAHLFQRRGMQQSRRAFRAASISHLHRRTSAMQQEQRSSSRRRGGVLDIHTWVRIPVSGTYQLALRGSDSMFLLWSERETPLVQVGGNSTDDDDESPDDDGWHTSREVHLEAGVYPLRVVQVSRRTHNVVPGWVVPGAAGPEPIPVERMVYGRPAMSAPRRESIDAIVQADFSQDVQPSYQFRGLDGVYAQVRLEATSVDWLGGSLQHEWRIGPLRGQGRTWSPRLPAGTHEVELVSRNATGFEGRVTGRIRVGADAMQEHRLSARLQGVPAVAYEEDRVWPDLWLYGSTPDDLAIDATLRVRFRDGRSQVLAEPVLLQREWGRLRGEELPVGRIEQIDWTLHHAGVPILSETVRFLREPFAAAPDHAQGDALYAGAERGVWVARRTRHDEQNRPARHGRRLLFVDSTLNTTRLQPSSAPPRTDGENAPAADYVRRLTALLAGPDPRTDVQARYLRYDELTADPESSLHRLAPLAALERLAGSGRAVLSLGLEAWLDQEPPETFERRLAVLCGLLTGPLGLEVLLVTPPPFSNDAESMRPYAAAVLRVADAHGLAVADLFTVFTGHPNPALLRDDLRITRAGQELAAEVLARTLLPNGTLLR